MITSGGNADLGPLITERPAGITVTVPGCRVPWGPDEKIFPQIALPNQVALCRFLKTGGI